jgi:uncharacterized protein
VRERIRQRLDALQADGELRVVYACESGSRAWGFPSADSDFDVRFLYLRPLSWYLAVLPRRDVVDDMIEGDLDLGGWDLRKALSFFTLTLVRSLLRFRCDLVHRDDRVAYVSTKSSDNTHRRDVVVGLSLDDELGSSRILSLDAGNPPA